ncbi:regulator of G-protein signaling 13 [Brachyhypopomus gauderio]|uniref:regulator of G-protein signaling 13 n=1 Tax=Brachyhypopomus gauderio TaxID=698409 RepID=UPI00404134B9
MPSLLTMSKEESKEERPLQTQRKDLKWRFQYKFVKSSVAEKLIPGETLLWSESLETLLRSKDGMATFQAFLKSEFSDENIEFWVICEDYKKIKSASRLNSRAKKIFERYIQTESPKEINIDYKTRELIKQNIKAPTTKCFDDAQKIVFSLMEKDSYPRFLRSDLYRTLLESVSNMIKV